MTFTVTVQNTCNTVISLNSGTDLINKDGDNAYKVLAANIHDVSLAALPLTLIIDPNKISYDSNLCGPLQLSSSLSPSTVDVSFDWSLVSNMFFTIGTGLAPTSANAFTQTVTITLTAS